uniref:PpSP15-like protein n=1 Tax=Sergentomyia schwetzi TaxID=114605 RepID=A0A6B9VJT2_9DIPT|nr:PpSP15-like protein [Sergentomyia schwetzi]
MKHLCIAGIFLTVLAAAVSEPILPSEKCRQEGVVRYEVCIGYCEYTLYNFVQVSFKIPRIYIENFKNVLLEYGAVDEKDSCKLEKHIKGCAEKMTITKEMKRREKCEKVNEYYNCVVDGNLFTFDKYAMAIDAYEKSGRFAKPSL